MAYESREKFREAYVDFRQVLYLDSSIDVAQQGSTRCSQHLNQVDGPRWREKLPAFVPIAPSLATLQSQTKPPPAGPPDAPRLKEAHDIKQAKVKPKQPSKEELFEKHKSEGNAFVKKGDYAQAIECYTHCMLCCPGNVTAYTNRALCYLKTNQLENVINDCQVALTVEPQNVKALFRRGLAYKDLLKYTESVNDFKELLKVDPKNVAARKEFAQILRLKQEHEMKRSAADTSSSASKPRQRITIEEVESSSEEEEKIESAKVHSAKAQRPKPSSPKESRKTYSAKSSSKKSKKSKDKPDGSSSKHESTSKCAAKSPTDEAKTKCTAKSPIEEITPSEGFKTKPTSKEQKQGSKSKTKSASKIKQTADTFGLSHKEKAAPVLEKATPYEFMQAWTSLKGSKDYKSYSELLEQVGPHDLKTVLSNKLDGEMLTTIIRCTGHLADNGSSQKALQYIQNLPKVPRFQMVAMFMSDTDKQYIAEVVNKLDQSLEGGLSPSDRQFVKREYDLK